MLRAGKAMLLWTWLTLLLLLPGCAPPSSLASRPPASPPDTEMAVTAGLPGPTATLSPPATPSLEARELTVLGLPERLRVRVSKIIGADTIEVQAGDGNRDVVRVSGVDAPDTTRPDGPGGNGVMAGEGCLEDWGHLAAQYAAGRLEGQWVTLVLDTGGREDVTLDELFPHGRLLVFVESGGEDYGALLLERGLARVRSRRHWRQG